MLDVLLKAAGFILAIVLAYGLKRIGFFGPKDYQIISRIVLNVTLPCAVIGSFASFTMQNTLLFVVLLGLLCNLIAIAAGRLLAGRRKGVERAFYMINTSGYNIGCFTMPYVQSFLGPFGVVVTCMFDVGNAVMCTGGTYALVSGTTGVGEEKTTVKGTLRKLVSSVPFDIYMLMLALAVAGIRIPQAVVTIVAPIGAANGFMAMFMIGLMFEIRVEKEHLSTVAKVLLTRYALAGAFAALFYFCTPFSLEIRQVLAILVFAPVGSLAPIFTEKCKGDPGVASMIGSISIVISVVIITTLLTVMQLG